MIPLGILASSVPTLPTVPGGAFGGGYYIGNITIPSGDDAGEYAIIMGGSDSEPDALAWKNTLSTTAGTISTTNGMANTLAMQANDPVNHYAGMYCLGYDGGGFDDWYLPAKDELNLAWANHSQLAALALKAQRYWSSTQDAAYYAWYQDFGNGSQSVNDKDFTYSVRPVRRIPITPD